MGTDQCTLVSGKCRPRPERGTASFGQGERRASWGARCGAGHDLQNWPERVGTRWRLMFRNTRNGATQKDAETFFTATSGVGAPTLLVDDPEAGSNRSSLWHCVGPDPAKLPSGELVQQHCQQEGHDDEDRQACPDGIARREQVFVDQCHRCRANQRC